VDSIIIVGTISNVEKYLKKDLNKIYHSLRRFNHISFFLVESDSTDNTIKVLNELSNSYANFNYTSLGILKQLIPDRIDRIRYCRNVYVDYIRAIAPAKRPFYTVVADLDGINSKINYKSVDSCFHNQDWDVVISNQTGGYYDIYALRCKNWQESDCFIDLEQNKANIPAPNYGKLNFYKRIRFLLYFDKARYLAIYSKMRKIGVAEPWVEVQSGFGGLAIYKTSIFMNYNYTSNSGELNESEHITIHQKVTDSGGKIFINPAFINSKWNTYNINRYFLIRQIRRLFYNTGIVYKIYKRLKLI
jgi:hypothetical protein